MLKNLVGSHNFFFFWSHCLDLLIAIHSTNANVGVMPAVKIHGSAIVAPLPNASKAAENRYGEKERDGHVEVHRYPGRYRQRLLFVRFDEQQTKCKMLVSSKRGCMNTVQNTAATKQS